MKQTGRDVSGEYAKGGAKNGRGSLELNCQVTHVGIPPEDVEALKIGHQHLSMQVPYYAIHPEGDTIGSRRHGSGGCTDVRAPEDTVLYVGVERWFGWHGQCPT